MDNTAGKEGDAGKENGAPETSGTGKVRSETTYPYFGLSKVIDIVQAVRRAGGNDAAPAADVLRELNCTKNDRIWAYGIPAGIYFGVIERIGRGDDARVKLTALGLRIALPGTDDEARATMVAVFKSPELYSKLLERFAGHPVPSKDVLRNILQRDFKIVESMAGNAADAFLDSLKVADLISPTGTITASTDRAAAPPVDDKKDRATPPSTAGTSRVVMLPGGGSITIGVNVDLLKLKGKSREFVFGLIDMLDTFEEQNPVAQDNATVTQ